MADVINYEKLGKNWGIAVREYFTAKKHWHNEYEVCYVLRGQAVIYADGRDYTVRQGECFILCPGIIHFYYESEEDKRLLILRLKDDFVNAFSEDTREYYLKFYNDLLHIKKEEKVRRMLSINAPLLDSSNEAEIESELLMMFTGLSALLFRNPDWILERIPAAKIGESFLLSNMAKYIDDHISEKISLDEMAEYLGFSKSYCSKYIKKKTGVNFLDYVNVQRIDHAKTLLRNTGMPITEIAYATGFSSIQTFNRVFKIYTSYNPSEYKNSVIGQKI